MDWRLGCNRRRALSAALLSVALVASIAVFAATSGATETARLIATLDKSCVAGPGGAPVFTLKNVSNENGMAQTVHVEVYDRYYNSNPANKVAGPITLTPGQTVTFTATGWPWKSAYKPDRQYYAFFSAVVHVKKKGKVPAHDELQNLKTHEFCKCSKPSSNPTTTISSSTTSTTKPTTTTTSTSTTTTVKPTTTTSTSTTTTSTTTTTVPPTTTTSTSTTTTSTSSTTTTTIRF